MFHFYVAVVQCAALFDDVTSRWLKNTRTCAVCYLLKIASRMRGSLYLKQIARFLVSQKQTIHNKDSAGCFPLANMSRALTKLCHLP